jgi:hypothetical protein
LAGEFEKTTLYDEELLYTEVPPYIRARKKLPLSGENNAVIEPAQYPAPYFKFGNLSDFQYQT